MRLLHDRAGRVVLALISVLVLLVSGNMLARYGLSGLRLDLTQEKLFTLSPGAKQALAKIEEPVTLRLFLSERLVREIPSFGAYAQRVRDMLDSFVAASHGKLTVQVLDPQPFSNVEDRALAYGLQGVPLDQAGEQVFFGLVGTNTTDDEEVIPFLQPERERFLEYDLARTVLKLANPKRRVVGMLSTLPIEGDMTQQGQSGPEPWLVYDQIKQFFDVKPIEQNAEEIPKDIDVLMLVHPAGLPAKTRFAIDQFVLGGGKVLAFVDPVSEAAAWRSQAFVARGMPPGPDSSPLPDLLAAWGVTLEADKIVADRRLARRVSAGPNSRVQAADYLLWLGLPATQMARDDAITGDLQAIAVGSAGALVPVEGATTVMTPLLRSTPQSMLMDASKARGQPDVLGVLRAFRAQGQALTLAARITGPAKTAFPGGAPKEEGAEAAKPDAPKPDAAKPDAAKPAPLKESVKPISVVVVADTDMLEDRFWAQAQQFFGQKVAVPTANNADFVVNALENLSGSDATASLRSRGVSDRPFTLMKEIQQDAEGRFRDKERALLDRVKETEKKLAEMRRGGGDGAAGAAPSGDQAKEIEKFRGELLAARQELRQVQRALKEDIEGVQQTVRVATIGGAPVMVALVALGLGAWRRRRSQK